MSGTPWVDAGADTPERVRAAFAQLASSGIPVGTGLIFDSATQLTRIDPAWVPPSSTEVVTARTGRTSWTDGTTITFASLDARLDKMQTDEAEAWTHLAADLRPLWPIIGPIYATGSMFRLCQTIMVPVSPAWVVSPTTTIDTFIGGVIALSFPYPLRSLNISSGGVGSWSDAPAAYNQARYAALIAVVAQLVQHVRTLTVDLQNKMQGGLG